MKLFLTPSYRTKVKILKKKKILIAHQKNLVPRMLITAKMFEHRNYVKNRRKRIGFFFRKLTKGIQGFDLDKKISKLSRACVPLNAELYIYV
jgi:hypothetical protein